MEATMNMKGISIVVASVLALAWTSAHACESLPEGASAAVGAGHPYGELLDLNGDNCIFFDEYVHSTASKGMRELDADEDGQVSVAEAASAAGKGDEGTPLVKFSRADANGDGGIDFDELKDELRASPAMMDQYRALDKDENNSLEEPEFGSVEVVPQIHLHF